MNVYRKLLIDSTKCNELDRAINKIVDKRENERLFLQAQQESKILEHHMNNTNNINVILIYFRMI